MSRYLLFRVGQMALVVLGVLTVLFVILRLSGDPVLMLAPPDASPAEIESLRHALGFSDPVRTHYLRYLGQLARLDFGRSPIVREPALEVILTRVPATGQLAPAAFVIAVPLGVVGGAYAAVWASTRAW